MPEKTIHDAVIVGAGFSGLSAARKLVRKGLDVVVLEARDRVGGRIETEWLDSTHYVDLGGQWIGPTQDTMYELLNEYGVEYFPTYQEGKSLLHFDGKLKQYDGLIPPLPVPSLLNLEFALRMLNRSAKKVDPLFPWKSTKAKKWDNQTLEQWLSRNVPLKLPRRLLKIAIESIYAADTSSLSFLHTLVYLSSGGSDLNLMMDLKGGAQQDRIYGGAQQIAQKMADELGEALRLQMPVDRVAQVDEGVVVSAHDENFLARRVIMSIPPPLLAKIDFSPSLPLTKRRLIDSYFMGSVIKCYAIYDRPFWRKKGLNGLVATDSGFVSVTFDNSPKEGNVGMIMGFVLGEKAKEFRKYSESERKQLFLAELKTYLGEQAADARYIDKVWADEEWSEGCYAGMLPKGIWTDQEHHLGQPLEKLHFAGTETASVWNGYMEGAVLAGRRAADEVLNALLVG